MPEQLKKYFNGISYILTHKAEVAGVFRGKGDIGTCREIIFAEFLEKHVSKRFNIGRGGEIFGANSQKSSGQIDIIINHDMSPAFKENSLVRCPIESKGCGLFWIINEISKGLSWLSGMYVDYNKYYTLAYSHIK